MKQFAGIGLQVLFPVLAAASLAAALPAAAGETRKPVTEAPAAAIAAAVPFRVDSDPDPSFALIDALVDIGTLRQVGDAIEAELSWPLRLGVLRDTRANYPGVAIPENSTSADVARVVCRPDGMLYYRVQTTIKAPDGTVLARRTFDPDEERRKMEERERSPGIFHGQASYSSDPFSLVCWAAARKCQGKAFSWPPPKNNTPLERSGRADKMRAEYNAQFVPRCRL